jgi:CAAX prenyl protease-like protein
VLRWLVDAGFLRVAPSAVTLRSFLVTMGLFGIEHNLWLAGMLAGAAYNFIYMRSSSLWAAILAHGITNGLLGCWIVSTGMWTYW